MHIAIDARFINTSTGTYVRELINNLEKIDKDNDYSILVLSKDIDYWKPTNPNFKLVAADFDFYSIAEQFGFKKFLENLNPDLVHFGMPQQPVWYKGKTVTTFHDLTLLKTYNSDKNWLAYHFKQFVGKFVFQRAANTSDYIITPSEYTKKELLEFFPGIDKNKIVVSYESADVKESEIEPYELPYKSFLLYVGQQSDYKNIKRLGDAHQKLLEKYPKLGLVLVGKKNKSALANEAYFTSNGYKNILFTDFIPDSQRDWLFKNCQAYVFPSLMEGFGLPGLEAMGYGAPVVSSNATCLPEIYGDAAYYFDPLNTDNMVKSIDKILIDEQLRQKMIRRGYEQLKKYSWKRMAEETLEVYKKALDK